MSERNVYTVDNVEFTYNTLDTVTMLFNDGTYTSLFKMTALVDVVGVVIAAAITAGKILSLEQMGIAIVMYFIFFSVSIRVSTGDVTTDRFKAVDDIPTDLAAAASLISTVGYTTTEKMEQAFSVPSMTGYGSLGPLFTLTALYDTMKSPMRWTGGTESYGDLDGSIFNYIRNCVSNDIIHGSKTFVPIYHSNQGVSGLISDDSFQRAVIYDNVYSGWPAATDESAKGGSLYTYADAYTKLKGLATLNSAALDASFARSYAAAGRTCGDATYPRSGETREALNFFSIVGTDIRNLQLMMVMYPSFKEMPMYGLESSFRGTAVITRAQTMTQQVFQWSSSGSSFLS